MPILITLRTLIVRPLSSFSLGCLLLIISARASAEWTLTSSGTLYYTDDVGIFSATRRLSRDSDPTQPAIDSKLTGQGSDGVFEPMVKLGKSFSSAYGTTTFDLRGDAFVFFDQTRYSHGTLQFQGQQAFTPETKLSLRYYYSPDLFLGDNEERRSGHFEEAEEEVTSHIGSIRLDQELQPGLELRLLARYGARLYNEAFEQRNTNFWTVGPHLEWQVLPKLKLGLAYHYEKGLADGRNQPQFEDDISYVNHYSSIDLDIELSERFSLMTAFHYEYNDWLSHLEGDERNGAHETVYQGEVLLIYRVTEQTRAYTGMQYSKRKESFEEDAIANTNVGIRIQTDF